MTQEEHDMLVRLSVRMKVLDDMERDLAAIRKILENTKIAFVTTVAAGGLAGGGVATAIGKIISGAG